MRKTLLCLAAVALALPAAAAAVPLPQGVPAPDFELSSLAGGKIGLGDVCAGDAPAVLAFFATWCDTCLKEIKYLRGVAKRHGAAVYLVGIDPDREKLQRFVEKEGIEFPVLHDPDGKAIGKKYDLFRGAFAVIPKAYVLSPAKTVEYVSESYDAAKMSMLDKQVALVKAKKWEKGREAVIFFTSSGNGRLTAGGYRSRHGGLVKLVSYIKAKRERNPGSLLVDSGDFLPHSVSTAAAENILKVLALAGYDALGVGDQDAAYGGLAEAAKAHGLPLLASNLRVCRAGRCTPAGALDKIVERGGVKIRFLSFIPPEPFALYPEEFTRALEFGTLEEMLRDGKKADFLVLLSHAGADGDMKIAAEVKGIDLIIGGHSRIEMHAPERVGEALVVQAGADFANVGKLTLKFDSGKKLEAQSYELVPLTADIPDDPQLAAQAAPGKNLSQNKQTED